MTLRQKTILSIIVTVLCLFLALDGMAWRFLHEDLRRLEKQEARKGVARIEQAWMQRQRRLEATTRAWAQWDDAYRFAQDSNEAFRRANLTGDALLPAEANALIIVRRDGKVLATLGFDLKSKRTAPFPEGFKAHLQTGGALNPALVARVSRRGLLLVNGKPMIIASEPILPTNGKKPGRGAWIFARYFDEEEVKYLSQVVGLPLSMQLWNSDLASDFKAAQVHLHRTKTPAVQVLSEESIAGYARLDDLYNRPALMLRAAMPREIYRQGRANLLHLRRSLAVMGVVFCLVTVLLMERLVLRRLGALSLELNAIQASRDANARLDVMGRDELASLSHAFNATLATLQQTQAALRERQKQFDRIVANVPGVVFRAVRNADGVLLVPFASEGSRRLFGVEPEVLQSDVQGLLRLIYPPDRAAFTDSWQAAECTQSRWQWEGRVLTSEGTARWVSGVAHPDVQEDGAIVWDGLLTDISKRKRAEAALQIAHDELELRVASRTAELRHSNTKLQAEISERQMAEEALRSVLVELEQARVEAEAANRAKSEFLSRVSHELRTPMNAILGFAQLLEWDNLPEEQMESVQQILRAGRHLLKLINEVLDISNIEAGAIAISAQSIEADRLCEEVLALIRPLAEKENVALQTAGQAAELHIWADALRLRQVLLNLLSNAVKYNRPGGSVTLGAAAVGEGRVRLWVSDTGWGLSEAQQSRLFMPFDRLGAERSEVEGTGIGLVLARRLVEAMGGTIGVESEEGKGSTFWIELPSEAVQSNTSNTEAMAAGVA